MFNEIKGPEFRPQHQRSNNIIPGKQLVQHAWSWQALITFYFFIKLWIINNNSNVASGQVRQLRTYQLGFLRLPGPSEWECTESQWLLILALLLAS